MDIKTHIIENFKNDSEDSIRSAIVESIKENDDITLPGLGVFFSLVWTSSDDEFKNKTLSLLKNSLQNNSNY